MPKDLAVVGLPSLTWAGCPARGIKSPSNPSKPVQPQRIRCLRIANVVELGVIETPSEMEPLGRLRAFFPKAATLPIAGPKP